MTISLPNQLLGYESTRRCMTPSTKKLIGGAILAIIGLGLAFLSHYRFSEAWNSIHTVVPLAVGSAALTYLAIKVYRQWGVEEKSYEIDNFFATFDCDPFDSQDPLDHIVCYRDEKLNDNYSSWLERNVRNKDHRSRIGTIIRYCSCDSFMPRSQDLVESAACPISYNILGKEENWIVEIRLQTKLQHRVDYIYIIDIQVDITTGDATCTTSLIPS